MNLFVISLFQHDDCNGSDEKVAFIIVESLTVI